MSSVGEQADGDSAFAALSRGGRYVSFGSEAGTLIPGGTSGIFNVFVRDRLAGVTELVSVGRDGEPGSSGSLLSAISASGRYVAFESFASNLVAGDTNASTDVFVRDLVAGVTQRVSLGPNGREGNRGSIQPAISADGQHVVFASAASNLVPGDTNRRLDVFVRDRLAGVTELVSVGRNGEPGNLDSFFFPVISAGGRFVAFESEASNLVGRDSNGVQDVFVRDRLTGTTLRVSVGPNGRQGSGGSGTPSISASGRYVAFESEASNLVGRDTNGASDVFVRDVRAGVTQRVSLGRGQANSDSDDASISADGRFVAFESEASNLVTGDTNRARDVFVRDRLAGLTRRVSVSGGGAQAEAGSFRPHISADGQHVAFESDDTGLVTGDTNEAKDVFVRDRFGDAQSLSTSPRPG